MKTLILKEFEEEWDEEEDQETEDGDTMPWNK